MTPAHSRRTRCRSRVPSVAAAVPLAHSAAFYAGATDRAGACQGPAREGVDFRGPRVPRIRGRCEDQPGQASCSSCSSVLVAAWGRPGAADPRLDAARAHSQEGDAYYKLEKYANAITEYEQAYLAKPDPSFLYNIAQCHRLMGQRRPEAIKFYRRFLKDAPNAPNRAVAEKHIRDLEDSAAHGTAPSPPVLAAGPPSAPAVPPPTAIGRCRSRRRRPTSAPPRAHPLDPLQRRCRRRQPSKTARSSPPTESHPIYSRWWFWAGVGAVVVGGIILIAATAKHDPPCPGGIICQGTEALAEDLIGGGGGRSFRSSRAASGRWCSSTVDGAEGATWYSRHRRRSSRRQ